MLLTRDESRHRVLDRQVVRSGERALVDERREQSHNGIGTGSDERAKVCDLVRAIRAPADLVVVVIILVAVGGLDRFDDIFAQHLVLRKEPWSM